MSFVESDWSDGNQRNTLTEEIVEIPNNDDIIYGTLTVPMTTTSLSTTTAVVLLLHGFTGNRHELSTEHVPEGVFPRVARSLAKMAAFPSLRIDFRGSGDSIRQLNFCDTTFEGQIQDVQVTIDYLVTKRHYSYIHMIGWSQGGLVAAAAAGRQTTGTRSIASLTLWNAVADPMATYSAVLGADVVQSGIAARSDELIRTEVFDNPVELAGAFFHPLPTLRPAAELMTYEGPLLVVQGSEDDLVPQGGAQLYLDAHCNGPNTLWLTSMDHVFNIFTTDAKLEEMMRVTLAFIMGNG